jgi:hypothetical protein
METSFCSENKRQPNRSLSVSLSQSLSAVPYCVKADSDTDCDTDSDLKTQNSGFHAATGVPHAHEELLGLFRESAVPVWISTIPKSE